MTFSTSPIIALAALASLVGCVDDTGAYGDNFGSDVTEENGGGKADGEDSVVVTQHDAALYTRSLKTLLCNRIADATPSVSSGSARTNFLAECRDFSFRVKEQARSTLYASLSNGDPLTIWMKIDVTGNSTTWKTQLDRSWSATDAAFSWLGSVLVAPDSDDAWIQAIVDDPEAHLADVRLRAFTSMPSVVKTAANNWLDNRMVELIKSSGEDPETIYGTIAESGHATLLRDGEIIGYRVNVEWVVGNGEGGAALYLDRTGRVVIVQEWDA